LPLVINARVDLYLKQVGDEASRFAETVKRAEAYLAAGADCIFPFALADLEVIGKLAAAIKAPINIVGRAGAPPLRQLEAAGVARVSVASGPALTVMSLIQRIATELRGKGEFDILHAELKRVDAQQLFAKREGNRP
jgi:2-methylisocitrate lyase-like PEP mutase family enzyme